MKIFTTLRFALLRATQSVIFIIIVISIVGIMMFVVIVIIIAYFIFVADAADIVRGEFVCHVEKL